VIDKYYERHKDGLVLSDSEKPVTLLTFQEFAIQTIDAFGSQANSKHGRK
jgi:hypothetical protein